METTPLPDERGFVLPVLLIFLVLATLGGMAAARMSTQQAGSSRDLGASVTAMLTAEAGVANLVARFVDEDFEWLANGTYQGTALLAVGAALPSAPSGAANHGTSRWWVESMEFDGDEVRILVAGTVPNIDVVRRVEVIYVRGSAASNSVFGAAVVGCNGVGLNGSGLIDSYNSQTGAYAAGSASAFGNVYTLSPPGHITLSGGARIRGSVTTFGNFTMDNGRVDGQIGAMGNVRFEGNPFCPLVPVEAVGTITRPGAWWCPASVMNPGASNVTLPSDTCDPLNVDVQVVGALNAARPGSPAGFQTTSYLNWMATPANITTNTAYSNGFAVGAGNTVNIRSGNVTQIFVQGNVNVGGGSTVNIVNPNVTTPSGVVRWFIDGNLTLEGGATLSIDSGAALEIYVTGTTNIGGGLRNRNNQPTMTMNVNGQPTTIPTFALYSSFAGAGGVRVGGDTQLYASIYAPRTGVIVEGSGGLYGAARGLTMSVTGAGGVHYDESLGLVQSGAPTVAADPRVRSWKEVVGSAP